MKVQKSIKTPKSPFSNEGVPGLIGPDGVTRGKVWRLQPKLEIQTPNPAALQSVNGVPNKESPPKHTVVGRYHQGDKIRSERGRILDKGFAADSAGNAKQALQDYALAFGLLVRDVTSALGREVSGLSGATDLSYLEHLHGSGAYDEIPPDLKTDVLKYTNRKGLALKHTGDLAGASSYLLRALTLDANYGAAIYNMAAVQHLNGNTSSGLDHLDKAVADESFDFKKLARESDTDWNDIRLTSGRFRALVGLPPLPASQ